MTAYDELQDALSIFGEALSDLQAAKKNFEDDINLDTEIEDALLGAYQDYEACIYGTRTTRRTPLLT